MKKRIIAMAAIAAAFTMASCEKEQPAEPMTGVAGYDIITASTESAPTKLSLNGNDTDGYEVLWSAGDKIKIGDNVFTLIDGEGTTNGTFKGNLPEDGTYNVNYPATGWTYKFVYAGSSITGMPMESKVEISDGKLSGPIRFKNRGGIVRLTLKGTATIHKIVVMGNGQYSLLCGGGVALDNTDGKVFYIPYPATEPPINLGFRISTVDGRLIVKKPKASHYIIVNRSQITDISFSGINSTAAPDILPGLFSVAEGTQVHFSKGNLRYTVDSGKWSFFDRQYEFGPSSFDAGHNREISLFTWGYSSKFSKNPSSATGLEDVNYGDFSPNNDWGTQIGASGTWRTLTSAEWQYLFDSRKDAAKKYGYAKVCGVKGVIILPDEFEDPLTNGGNGSFKPQSAKSYWIDNVYASGGEWEEMEYAGAVFLPITGIRSESVITFPDEFTSYWSSTAIKKVAGQGSYAYSVGFGDYKSDTDLISRPLCSNFEGQRKLGHSVRLVSGAYTVTFDLNGMSGTAPQSIGGIMYGSTITKPDSPSSSVFLFTGWYKDVECKSPWYFDTDRVCSNITLYAGWSGSAIPGKFSVAGTKQVYFSKGNLWADASGSNESNPVLHFEDKQYAFNSKYESSHVSHFTWNSSVSGTVGASGAAGNFFCDESHKISVDGSAAMYYTLSQKEWAYLLNLTSDGRRMDHYGRPTHSINIFYCGKKGIVIYPDYYDDEPLSPDVDYTEETFPKDCVFLPCAGWRDGKTMRQTEGWGGFYWSSSAKDNLPYHLELANDGVYLSDGGNVNNALSTRLVATLE